jgi:hypothetical protein
MRITVFNADPVSWEKGSNSPLLSSARRERNMHSPTMIFFCKGIYSYPCRYIPV